MIVNIILTILLLYLFISIYKSYKLYKLYSLSIKVIEDITKKRINLVKTLIKNDMNIITYDDNVIKSIYSELVLFLYVNLFTDRVYRDIDKYVKQDDNIFKKVFFNYKKSYNKIVDIIAYNIYLTNDIDKLITIDNFVEFIDFSINNKNDSIKKIRTLQLLIALSHRHLKTAKEKEEFHKLIDKLESEIM